MVMNEDADEAMDTLVDTCKQLIVVSRWTCSARRASLLLETITGVFVGLYVPISLIYCVFYRSSGVQEDSMKRALFAL